MLKILACRFVMLFPLCLLAIPAPTQAGDFAEAKSIIADMQKIVTPDGVQELFSARIGGAEQWLSVRGKDRDNPLLLFVHGGPASPMMPVAWTFQYPWEEYFTVVQWDQRGAGKSYRSNDPVKTAETIRVQRYIDDTIEVIELLRERYGKRKVVLVGHSWGTIVALGAAIKRPDLVHAYVGIGQVINGNENERVGFEFALAQAKREGNDEALSELAGIAPYPGGQPIRRERIGIQRKWAQHYGGLAAYRSDFAWYFNVPKLSPLYDEEDRRAIDKGSMITLDRVLAEWDDIDYDRVTRVSFPVIMFMGRHDYSTPSEPTARWLEKLDAPVKHGVWFENSSHLVPMEEPGKTLLKLVELVRPLAQE